MMFEPEIPHHLKTAMENELNRGERLLWVASPKPKFLTKDSLGAFLFSIPWTAFAIFWMLMASGILMGKKQEGPFSIFPLFGLPFVLIGIFMMTTPLRRYRKSFRLVYGITPYRAIIMDVGRKTNIKNYYKENITKIERIDYKDGSGDIYFAEEDTNFRRNNRTVTRQIGFEGVWDTKKIEALIKKIEPLR